MNNVVSAPLRHLDVNHNVTFLVRDAIDHHIVSVHKGHNAATNGMLTGIAHYLVGDGVLNQGWHLLQSYVPQYISLGTMGLISQSEDTNGLPDGIGVVDGTPEARFTDYILQCPGYGADGYDANLNNGRTLLGLGPMFKDRESTDTINCELISDSFPRAKISYRDIVPETEAEFPQTIDVIFSAMISTGALAQFREPGKDYLFITEAGLWSSPNWTTGGDNGLLAGYRIAPPNKNNWGMDSEHISNEIAISYLTAQGITNPTTEQINNIKPTIAAANRQLLQSQIIRVGINQVVQVIWKIQLGGVEQLTGLSDIYTTQDGNADLYWGFWN